jgi:hypothetical protein
MFLYSITMKLCRKDGGCRNSYSGFILKNKEGVFSGIASEENYNNRVYISGKFYSNEKIDIEIIGNERICSETKKSNWDSKESLVKPECFYGITKDKYDDILSIELIDMEDIKKAIINPCVTCSTKGSCDMLEIDESSCKTLKKHKEIYYNI